MLVTPFMNCGAKMPVYAMLIAAFFPNGRTRMMLLLWAISWIVTLLSAWFLRKFVIRGEQTPFVMELPAYHVPTARGVFLHTWDRTWMYLKKAGTLILVINILIWALMYFPRVPAADLAGPPENEQARIQLEKSFAGRMGRGLESVSQYAGLDWRVNISLVGGFAAKELVIGVLGMVYAMDAVDDAASLSQKLKASSDWNPLKALTLMLFVMIYAPCFVTIVTIWREAGSWRWALFSTLYSTTLAYVIAVAVYQTGRLLGF
jgi:ferrous iron transport protein B